MKKIYLFFVFVLAVLSVKAQVTFSVDDFKIKPGETKTMEFTMQATREVAAFDFYVRMPEGLEIVYPAKNRLTMSEWGSDLSGFADPKSDGSGDCHFTVYSQTGDPIAAGSGTIFQIDVKASEDVALGEASIYMYEFAIADGYGDEIMVDYTDLTSTMRFYEEYNLSATSSNEGWGSASMDPSGVVENGTEVTATATPAEGYEFVNWTKGDDVVSTDNPYTFTAVADLALVANFKAIKYDVTFDVDGVKTTESLDYGTVITKPEDPTKEGYTFAGWDPEFVEGATVPVGGITYTATWTVNSHTITFNTNGGSEIEPMTLDYGTAIVLPDAPTREGYEFAGWAEEVPETMPDRDLVLNATWNVLKYTVKFVVDGVAVYEESLDYGTVVTKPADPVKEGYTFAGWDPEFVEGTTVPVGGLTYNATWNVNYYTLTFKWNDVVYSTASVAYGSAITAPETPEREGYEFTGWTPEVPEVMPAEDLTFEATWNVLQYTVKFVVDGVAVYEESLDYGTVVTKPADPVKEGYTFAGWDPEFVEGTTVPVGGLTYNATWNVNYYTLTFKWNDVVYSTASVAYGSAITAPETPEREGYEFTGWTPEVPEVMPAEDLTFEATWDICYYEVSFVVDGEVVQSENLAYGSEIVAPEVAEKEGYTFVGWSPELLQYVPSYDVVFTAQFEVNVYTLTYYLDEEVVYSTELEYGAPVEEYTPEVAEGRKFDGWQEEIPEFMPAHDVDIHGTTSEIPSGIAAIVAELGNDVDIYNLQGRLLIKNADAKRVSQLPAGIYIINGKKYLKK